ncbi:MAG: hypothetical protein JJ966_05265 [Balneolaceae bacterium]|nr:hypothetical protein [Balneolaceae bacterium]
MKIQQFLEELKRRNVFRVATAYTVTAWLIMQVVTLIEDPLMIPDWVDTAVILLLLSGFPIAVVIGWVFELTPEGVKKTDEIEVEESFNKATGQKLNHVIIGVLSLIVIFFVAEKIIHYSTSKVDQAEIVEINDASIAVLPFNDLSPNGDQAYFADGISEELLNALSQYPDLKVAARTSSFAFRDESNLTEIGSSLAVEHVLDGSVRRSDDRLRVTAQLIRASDGYQVWSQTFESEESDIFVIQDEIVSNLATVLQIRLGVGGGTGRSAGIEVNPQAYEQYLRGLSSWAQRFKSDETRKDAIDQLRLATELDPTFSDAWSAYATSMIFSFVRLSGFSEEQYLVEVQNALEKAIELDDENFRAHSALGAWFSFVNVNIEKAEYHVKRGVELAPNSSFTHYSLMDYYRMVGDTENALRSINRAIALDPLNTILVRVKSEYAFHLGMDEMARRTVQQCGGCIPDNIMSTLALEGGIVTNPLPQLWEKRSVFMDYWDTDLSSIRVIEVDAFLDTLNVAQRLSDHMQQHPATYTELPLQYASMLAHIGDYDEALRVLFDGYEKKSLFGTILNEFTLREGRKEFPDDFRRHPKYHEFWELPGMPELAKARRNNGVTAGLPLPVGS